MDNRSVRELLTHLAAMVGAEDFDLDVVLGQLCSAIVGALDVDAVGVMLTDSGRGKRMRLVRATEGRGMELERLQEVSQAGPCMDSARRREEVVVADVRVEGSVWPQYQAQAAQLGLTSVTAVPLLARDRCWGVLDLYRCEPGELPEEVVETARMLAGVATSYVVLTDDHDRARSAQVELGRRAMTDSLSGLPVRWVFVEHLTHALSRLGRRSGRLAVLFLDVDGLKYVNDTYGHHTGDALLVHCARRIRAAVRPADIVARIGGDEFVVLLEDLEDDDAPLAVTRRILAAVGEDLPTDGTPIRPSASIGLAVTGDPATPAATLIAHADSAMYAAKRSGRGQVRVFDPGAYAAAAGRDELENALQGALDAGQLDLHYQPIIDLTSGRCHAVEALMRWHHPTRGLLPAAQFIGLAERAPLIRALTTWSVTLACEQLRRWDAEVGVDESPQQVFVNISPIGLPGSDLDRHVAAALEATGLAPDRLVLEITESGAISGADGGEGVEALILRLRDLGVQFALDDVGTGYSSLHRLARLPVTTLKIDQSFTQRMLQHVEDSAVIAAVLLLGHNLHHLVVVEGVESAETTLALRELGCTYAQGYHLALPAPADTITDLLRHQPALAVSGA